MSDRIIIVDSDKDSKQILALISAHAKCLRIEPIALLHPLHPMFRYERPSPLIINELKKYAEISPK